jgi:hypothetical protein
MRATRTSLCNRLAALLFAPSLMLAAAAWPISACAEHAGSHGAPQRRSVPRAGIGKAVAEGRDGGRAADHSDDHDELVGPGWFRLLLPQL